jgi:hypothetical protein
MHISFILSSTNLRKFVIVASVFVLVVAMIPSSRLAAASPHSAGYHHGCNDAKISNVGDRYISQPGKGPSFHTQEFMNRYNAGLRACSNKPSPMDSSTLFIQGYAKGVLDAKSHQKSFLTSNTMSPDDVDCDSDIDPQVSNADYCSAYQHGFADAINNAVPTTRELLAAKSLPPVTSTKLAPVAAAPPPKVCPDGSALGASGNCPPATQAPTDQGTTVTTTNDNTNTKHHKGTDLGRLGGSLLNSDNDPAPPPPNGGDNTNNNNNDNNNKPSKDHKGGQASTQPASPDQGTQ